MKALKLTSRYGLGGRGKKRIVGMMGFETANRVQEGGGGGKRTVGTLRHGKWGKRGTINRKVGCKIQE